MSLKLTRFCNCYCLAIVISLTSAQFEDLDDEGRAFQAFASSEETDDLYSFETEDPIYSSPIERTFTNRASFNCSSHVSTLVSGSTVANLLPEDISIIAAMGDGIAAGMGMWPGTDVEVRGATFPTGGDADLDEIPTIANVLKCFRPTLDGTSHGIGPSHTAATFPNHEFNVAESGYTTERMPKQAAELIARITRAYSREELSQKWVLLVIAVGSESICANCDVPNVDVLRRALIELRRAVPRMFAVLVGPVTFAGSSRVTYKVLRTHCDCIDDLGPALFKDLLTNWAEAFASLETEFFSRQVAHFVLRTLPFLNIEIINPHKYIAADRALLNKQGHGYATLWLWNSLITGRWRNVSASASGQPVLFCPLTKCPFLRSKVNFGRCDPISKAEFQRRHHPLTTVGPPVISPPGERRAFLQEHVLLWVMVLVALSSLSVFIFGGLFFLHGMKSKKGRFEEIQGV